MLGWLKQKRSEGFRLKATILRREVAPFHQVLSTLRREGKRKVEITALLLADIQEREQAIIEYERLAKRMVQK